MAAYVIVEIDIVDPAGYEEYKKQAAATVHKYGGKYIVRGGKTEALEGDWNRKRIVALEFKSMQRAKEWLTVRNTASRGTYGQLTKWRCDEVRKVSAVILSPLFQVATR